MTQAPSSTAARWARLGVLFNVSPSSQTPDLEQLLLDTAAEIPSNARLLTMPASWLSQFHRLVARHRLARMAGDLADREALAALGLLLDVAGPPCRNAIKSVRQVCRPLPTAMPLLLVDRLSPAAAEFAKSQASAVSKRWRLWCEPVALRPDAIRPRDWIMRENPSLQLRAVFQGGLRASILATLQHDRPRGASEAQFARLCGVTRKAIHEALDHLELCDLVQRRRFGRELQASLKAHVLRQAS